MGQNVSFLGRLESRGVATGSASTEQANLSGLPNFASGKIIEKVKSLFASLRRFETPALHADPNSGYREREAGDFLVRAPGAETPTPILGERECEAGSLLVRAPGAETPTPILGCHYWRRETFLSFKTDAYRSSSAKNFQINVLFSQYWGQELSNGECNSNKTPEKNPCPRIGVGVSAPGARTSKTPEFIFKIHNLTPMLPPVRISVFPKEAFEH